ncbi:hypothetical protein JCM19000A_29920 [Silvimonas sp. JCM 19000]
MPGFVGVFVGAGMNGQTCGMGGDRMVSAGADGHTAYAADPGICRCLRRQQNQWEASADGAVRLGLYRGVSAAVLRERLTARIDRPGRH